ncbi:MAG TPA: molybdenum cofactor guanylyltransferase [Candidatus Eremiobacteraceae bacterium]|nr:molybdenum cofactor guanylyltransferase [Candidatus Eremiobacteraceae bacterium]
MRAGDRISVVLMAGGPATRLPGKLALDVRGEPMLVYAFRRLTALGWPCVVSVRAPLAPQTGSALAGATVALDEISDGGPLGGMLSAAKSVQTRLFFAAAGDLPNLSTAFALRLLKAYDAAPRSPAAVMPTWPDGHVEPLAALYERDAFVRGAQAALAQRKRKVTAALDGLDVLAYRITSEDESALLNVNTPEDYEALGRMNSTATDTAR